MAGAPTGNTNSADGKRFRKALERALAHKFGSVDDGLLEVAKVVVKAATEGEDSQAAKEIADRMDGKPHQSIGTDADRGPLQVVVTATDTRL